jgi:Concanavalin A-like lectin/glucanases superfamily/Secretion system C-terminal sorting domain
LRKYYFSIFDFVTEINNFSGTLLAESLLNVTSILTIMGNKSTIRLRGLILGILILLSVNASFGQSGGYALYLQNANYLNHGDFVYCGSPNYGFTDKLTIACWVKWTTNPQTYVNAHSENEGMWANIITIDKHNSKDNGQFWLQHSSGNNNFEWAVQSVSSRQYIQSTTKPLQDVWYYIVGVYDGSSAGKKMILYVNGIEEASLSSGISGNIAAHSSLDRLNIGRLPNGYRLFAGCIDEIRIWKRVLDADEIRKQMFNMNTVNNTDLVSLWNMNAGIDTDVLDATTNHVDGKFYTALVDVHSFTASPYTITDGDKSWDLNTWRLSNIKTVAGNGVDETNVIDSNTTNVLTLQNAWTTTPKIDDLGTGTGMTWYGIEKSGEGSQWVISTASIGRDCKIIKTQDSSSVGWSGASLSIKISSVADNNNNLSIYFWGDIDALPVTGESYPSGITRRSNMVWGIREWGSVTSSIFISYPNIITSFNPATAILLGRTSGSSVWTQIPAVSDSVNRSFYAANLTNFNEYSIGMTEQTMPVKLESFNYSVTSNNVKLKWVTTEEINNSGYEIERSDNNGTSYSKISFVKGGGNSNGNNYSYIDSKLNMGEYKYRLKQIDYNGNYEYFYLISVVQVLSPNKFSLNQNYPNPSNPSSKIDYEIPVNGFVSIDIFDVSGRLVSKLVNEKQKAGFYSVIFNGSDLSSGVYYYRIFVKSEKDEFIKSRKLVLIK